MYKILNDETREVIPLRFNEAQVRLDDKIKWFQRQRLPIRIVACKARRAGMSTGVAAHIYHDTTFNENTSSLIVANQNNPSENVLGMYRRFWRYTPESIGGVSFRPPLPETQRGSPPRDKLLFPTLGDRAGVYVASAKSIDEYLSWGFQNIHATEVGYYDDGSGLFRALYPTLAKSPHSMLVMESTPNGMSGKGAFFYKQCMEAQMNEERNVRDPGALRLLFIPWHEMRKSFRWEFADVDKRAAFARTLNPTETKLLSKIEDLDLEQLLWRRMMLKGPAFHGDEDLFDQEYPSDLMTAFLSSGTMVFSRKAIKRLATETRDPIWRGDVYWGDSDAANRVEGLADVIRRPHFYTRAEAQNDGFASHVNEGTFNNLAVWEWPKRGDRLILTSDVSFGDPDSRNGDYSTILVGRANDLERDEVLMTWRGHLNPTLHGEVCSALAWACYRLTGETVASPELTIEWNGPGIPCNTHIDRFNLYPNTYRYIQPSVHGQPKTRHIGWESNDKTKPMMVAFTQRHVDNELIDIPDARIIQEMTAYRKFGDYGGAGDYGGESLHDDFVTALQILVVRLRQTAGTGQLAEAIDIEDAPMALDDGDIPWDPFEESSDAMLDDETAEEGLFYSGMYAGPRA